MPFVSIRLAGAATREQKAGVVADVTASLVAAETGYAWPMVERWLQALIASGFLETEDTPALSPATPLRLTTAGDAGVQQVLSGVGSPLTICSG